MQRAQVIPVLLLLIVAFGLLFFSVRSSTVADQGDENLMLLPISQVRGAPDWALPDAASGQTVRLSDEARQRPVVFSFWATWCGPCREELPHLERLSQKYRSRVAFYGVNSDDPPEAIRAFAQKIDLSFPMLSDSRRNAATRYGAESIPMLVIVDTENKVRAVSIGYNPSGNLEASLSKILDTLLTHSPPHKKETFSMTRHFLSAALFASAAASTLAAPSASTLAAAPTSPFATLEKAHTIQVTETVMAPEAAGGMHTIATMTVKLARPGQIHMEQMAVGSKTPTLVLVSDGKIMTQLDVARKQYRKMDAPAGGMGEAGLPALQPFPAAASVPATLNGKPSLLYTVVKDINGQTLTQKLWVDPQTRLPEQQSLSLGKGAQMKEVQEVLFSDWVLNKTVPATVFAFSPPAGATEFKPKPTPVLLAAGTVAPDFTVKDSDGKPVKLSDYKGKTVVLDFWATWCGPCQASLPHTNSVAQAFKDKNVVVLAVNVWDKQDAFDKWLPTHKQYDTIKFAIDTSATGEDVAAKLYNVSGIPTQYVIDPKGNIAKSFVGFGGPNDDLANAIKAAGTS